jgi:hypothetical protein
LGYGDTEFIIEPVVGWRAWRLKADADGEVTLTSPMQELLWVPRQPTRAICRSSPHRVPDHACMCGLYATSELRRLPRASVAFSGHVAVMGSVSLWGTVVEHAAGYRAGLGYPDRIRLICGWCFEQGREGVPTRVFLTPSGELIPACSVHCPTFESPLSTFTPVALERELLSRYAVDLLPLEALREAGFAAGPPSLNGFPAVVRGEARQLARSRVGWLGAAALVFAFFSLRALGILTSPEVPEPVDRGVVTAATPLEGTGDPVRYPMLEPAVEPLFSFAFVCGRLTADVVALRNCSSERANVAGFANLPPERWAACTGDGYTRTPRFSVCWFLDGSFLSSRPPRWRLPGVRAEELFPDLPPR